MYTIFQIIGIFPILQTGKLRIKMLNNCLNSRCNKWREKLARKPVCLRLQYFSEPHSVSYYIPCLGVKFRTGLLGWQVGWTLTLRTLKDFRRLLFNTHTLKTPHHLQWWIKVIVRDFSTLKLEILLCLLDRLTKSSTKASLLSLCSHSPLHSMLLKCLPHNQ